MVHQCLHWACDSPSPPRKALLLFRMGWERLQETGLRIAPGFLCARCILRTVLFSPYLDAVINSSWAAVQLGLYYSFAECPQDPINRRGPLGIPDEQGVHVALGLYLGGNQLSRGMTYGGLGRVKTGDQSRERTKLPWETVRSHLPWEGLRKAPLGKLVLENMRCTFPNFEGQRHGPRMPHAVSRCCRHGSLTVLL